MTERSASDGVVTFSNFLENHLGEISRRARDLGMGSGNGSGNGAFLCGVQQAAGGGAYISWLGFIPIFL